MLDKEQAEAIATVLAIQVYLEEAAKDPTLPPVAEMARTFYRLQAQTTPDLAEISLADYLGGVCFGPEEAAEWYERRDALLATVSGVLAAIESLNL